MPTAAERRAARRKLREQAGDESPVTKKARKRLQDAAQDSEATPSTLVRDADAPIPGSTPDAPPPSSPRSRDVVIVACKVPNGLILQNSILVDDFEPVFGGGVRAIKKGQPVGDPMHIIGPSRAIGADPDAKRVISGVALTYNVPKEPFEQWMKDNAALPVVKLGMIYAHHSEAEISARAKDTRSVKTGLEPLNTESRKADGSYVDPRMSKRLKKFNQDDDKTTMNMRVG